MSKVNFLNFIIVFFVFLFCSRKTFSFRFKLLAAVIIGFATKPISHINVNIEIYFSRLLQIKKSLHPQTIKI